MQQQGKHTLPCSAHSFRLGWCLRALGNFAHHLWMIQQGSPWSSQKNVIGFKEKKNAQAETLPFNFLSFLFNWSEILLSSPVWCSCFQWNSPKTRQKIWPAASSYTSFPFARSSLRSELTSWGNKATKRFTGVKRKFFCVCLGGLQRFCRNPMGNLEKKLKKFSWVPGPSVPSCAWSGEKLCHRQGEPRAKELWLITFGNDSICKHIINAQKRSQESVSFQDFRLNRDSQCPKIW